MNAIQQAIDAAGGPSRMAAALGVTAQAVCFWRDGKRRLPFDHGPAIERLAGGVVTRRQLFPDDWQRVWPELAVCAQAPSEDARSATNVACAHGDVPAERPEA